MNAIAEIIGTSPTITVAKRRAERFAKVRVPVLLLGPTGSGKEVFARALHDAGNNPAGPFVAMNCGAVTRELLASELFGYTDGAFTGARRGGVAGKFEAADGGTLFLDEIGEIPLELQSILLRALEEGEIYRLGENKPRRICVRIIAATNRDLRADVEAGKFRADLFYRLSVTVLQLPSLRERSEDIPQLVYYFIERAARLHGIPTKYPTARLLKLLIKHPWPGNIRELRNTVESMLLMSDGEMLTEADLPADIMVPSDDADELSVVVPFLTPGDKLADREKALIVDCVKAEQGNLTRAAMRLGIAKSTLYEKMKRHGIDRLPTLKMVSP